jgi:trk system potassium uptake protein TrkA
VLQEAGCREADLFIGATNVDELNLLSCSIAKKVGAARCIARVHHAVYFEERGLDYTDALGIDHLVCPEYSTAAAVVQALRSPAVVAIEQFARGKIDVQTIQVDAKARAAGQTLADLRLPRSARVVLVSGPQRQLIPGAQTAIAPGETVMLIANADEIDEARAAFVTAPNPRSRVVVVGGTGQGVWMCRALRREAFSVRLMVEDLERAEALAAKLEWTTVIHADLIDPSTYEEERIGRADAFITVTASDETNILLAARAKRMGVKCAIAVLQRPTYLRLLPDVGVDFAFSPRDVAVDHIVILSQTGPVRQLASLAQDVAVLYAVKVPTIAHGPCVGAPLREVPLPEKVIVAAIQRGDHVYVPSAADSVEPGDDVIVVGQPGIQKELGWLFGV